MSLSPSDNSDLDALRMKIDAIDRDMVELLAKRVSIARKIGAAKARSEHPIYFVPSRETALLEERKAWAGDRVSPDAVMAVFREVLSACTHVQKVQRVAFLGPEATFTHQAAIRQFGQSAELIPVPSIGEVVEMAATGRVDHGLIPIENSSEGVVFDALHALDTLLESDLRIVAQVFLDIRHCLVGKGPLSEIKKVVSKDQALAQCRKWLSRHLPGVVQQPVNSTAAAVDMAASEGASIAAVASRLAAESRELPVLEEGIQDQLDNETRFLVLSRNPQVPPSSTKDRTSLFLFLKDTAGALESALRPFGERGVNLVKIESRPSRRRAWEYIFYLEMQGHIQAQPVAEAIQALENSGAYVRWLGTYPDRA